MWRITSWLQKLGGGHVGKPSIEDVANYFLTQVDDDAGSVMTHLKLQKLCYYAQAWHLVWNDGHPLFNDEFEAWVHGPANRRLFTKYKEYGSSPILCPKGFDDGVFTVEQKETLNAVWEAYGVYDAKYLEGLAHQEDPWIKARGDKKPYEACDTVISRESMQIYYSALQDAR